MAKEGQSCPSRRAWSVWYQQFERPHRSDNCLTSAWFRDITRADLAQRIRGRGKVDELATSARGRVVQLCRKLHGDTRALNACIRQHRLQSELNELLAW